MLTSTWQNWLGLFLECILFVDIPIPTHMMRDLPGVLFFEVENQTRADLFV